MEDEEISLLFTSPVQVKSFTKYGTSHFRDSYLTVNMSNLTVSYEMKQR